MVLADNDGCPSGRRFNGELAPLVGLRRVTWTLMCTPDLNLQPHLRPLGRAAAPEEVADKAEREKAERDDPTP